MMERKKAGIHVLFLTMITLLLFSCQAWATNQYAYPEGTVEVPMGTEVVIEDSYNRVTILDPSVKLETGDTFVVYVQDLPLGYEALSVDSTEAGLVIEVRKATRDLYAAVKEEGDIAITSEDYEFYPAEGVEVVEELDAQGLSYDNGKLTLATSVGKSTAEIYLSDLHLAHSMSDGDVSLSLYGNWGLASTISVSDESLSEIPLGEMRIAGVGVVKLSFSITLTAQMQARFEGYFSTGINVRENGATTATKDISASNISVSGKGEVGASLKILGGVDVLIAAADVYCEIGVKTQAAGKVHYDESQEKSVSCSDYKYYVYSNAGAEAKCYNFLTNEMYTVYSQELELFDENTSPIYAHYHYEDGESTGSCRFGWEQVDWHLGGFSSSFDNTLEDTDRILETDVTLNKDTVITEDLVLKKGNLYLNGHTLTVEGDLIHQNGYLCIEGGTLHVKGSYREQKKTVDGQYEDSDGVLNMWNSDGVFQVDHDFIVQTTKDNELYAGTILVSGKLVQKDTSVKKANFVCDSGLYIKLETDESLVTFDSPDVNSLGTLVLDENAVISSSARLYGLDLNGHELNELGNLTLLGGERNLEKGNLIVNGDLFQREGTIDVDEGRLEIAGNYYHYGGDLILNHGKVFVHSDYLSIGADSILGKGEKNYVTGSGSIVMDYATDEFHVDNLFYMKSDNGNELHDGTLYLGGDLKELPGYSNNFDPWVEHTTVLNGTGTQNISFASPDSGFGALKAENENLAFSENVSWLTLASPLTAVSDGAHLGNRALKLNGCDVTFTGNVFLMADLTLEEGTFTVDGNLYHHSGLIDVSGGKVDVKGDYLSIGAGSSLTRGENGYVTGSGEIRMVYATDEFHVDGLFYEKSDNGNELRNGTMFIGGDFKEVTGHYTNFNALEDHTTVFNGTDSQRISFESPDAGFAFLESENTNLVFAQNVSWLHLGSDISAVSDGVYLQNRSMQLDGYTMALRGDVHLLSDLELEKGTFAVAGNLYHHQGMISLDYGNADISGDYYSIGEDSILGRGEQNYTVGGAWIRMLYPADEFRVGGLFFMKSDASSQLEQGTLYIGGDFKELLGYYNNYNAEEGHTTVFDGSGKQTISFESADAGFGTLEAVNTDLVFEKNVSWMMLGSDVTAISNNVYLRNRELHLNGYVLTLTGEVHLSTNLFLEKGEFFFDGSLYHHYGVIDFGYGLGTITGDYYSIGEDSIYGKGEQNYTVGYGSLRMVNAADDFHVGNLFLVKSDSASELTQGTLFIGGDFKEFQGYYENYSASQGHTTVFDGSVQQTVSFESPDACFGTLESLNADLVFTGNVNWIRLGSDVTAESQQAVLRSSDIHLNGYTLALTGDVRLYSDLYLEKGCFDITGDLYHHYGVIDLDYGRIVITGAYLNIGADSVLSEGKENYTVGNGWVKMVNAVDEFHVGGLFFMKSDSSSELSQGTLYLGGDFEEVQGYYNNFCADTNHVTVLNGKGQQRVTFESPDAGFGTLKASNQDLVFAGNVNWLKSGSDISANSERAFLRNREIHLNGYTLTLSGDVRKGSDLYLNNGSLQVNGSLFHHNGVLDLGGGKVNISNSYYGIGENSILGQGEENYTAGNGWIKMNYASDEFRVGDLFFMKSDNGSELNKGTLYVSGDFKQVDGYYNSFSAAEEHTTLLNGTASQTISFGNPDACFGTLKTTNENLSFTGNVSWAKLGSDLSAVSDHAYLRNRVLNLNGKNLTIQGDIRIGSQVDVNGGQLVVEGNVYHHDGLININGGAFLVDGSYYSIGEDSDFENQDLWTEGRGSIETSYAADVIRVTGDYYSQSSMNDKLDQGTMYIGGGLYDLTDRWSSFYVGKAVFDGRGVKHIYFKNQSGHFGVLELKQPINRYIFNVYPCWDSLIAPPASGEILSLPVGLQRIAEMAFEGDTSLEVVLIPDGSKLTSIETRAFAGCTGLQEIDIPASVSSIAEDAFQGDEDLVIVCPAGSYAQSYAERKGISCVTK